MIASRAYFQQVLPLMERKLAIFQLTPKAAFGGSWMSKRLLSRNAAAQKAKSTVANFPSDSGDLWKIKM